MEIELIGLVSSSMQIASNSYIPAVDTATSLAVDQVSLIAARAYCLASFISLIALFVVWLLSLYCIISLVIDGVLDFLRSRISQESSQESFQKERFELF